MEISGVVEKSGSGFAVRTERGPRTVAATWNETAAELVGQHVTATFTQQGAIDLARLGDFLETVEDNIAAQAVTAGQGEFFNPYTFIPAPPRSTMSAAFGDGPPCGHDRYHDDRWSGRIGVNLEVRSPLLATDAGSASWVGNHGRFPTRRHGDAPVVPASSVKGMLRAAFEALTASRFGLFDAKHTHRLAFRQQASQALQMVPARVTDDGQHLELLAGTTTPGNNGQVPHGEPQYAAWFPAYQHHPWLTLEDLGVGPATGARPPIKLKVKIRRARKDGSRGFDYWQVVEVLEYEHDGSMLTPARRLSTDRPSTGKWVAPETTREVTGWLQWTNQSFGRKHDERLFFTTADTPPAVALDDELRSSWDVAVKSSVDAHRPRDITDRPGAHGEPWRFLGRDPGETAWSPHLYDADRQLLGPGSLCYATIERAGRTWRGRSLHPVMIGREQFEVSPRELAVAAHVEPAASFAELSPADRVFGWVNTGKGDDQAVRGRVRVGFVEPVDARISEFGGDGIPLAILSGPKPTQARFYAAADTAGTPLPDGSSKRDGYRSNGGLRGRKVYPPHHVGDDHWKDPGNLQRSREFQRSQGTRDDQNRSVTSWIDVGSRFRFDLWVDNLSAAELGALLHLLDLDEKACLRLGAARPLGLGSVHLSVDWDRTWLPSPTRFADRYRSLLTPEGCAKDEIVKSAKQAFSEALLGVVGADGARKILDAFSASLHGGDGPVHYPRADPAPHPDGKNYEWFTRNERQERGRIQSGRGRSLPAPYGPLPFFSP